MAHWHAVIPPPALLELRYDALVRDPERQTRPVLAFYGLEWDARCLKFHRTGRGVRTFSAQVRQPMNDRAIGRSAAYRHWLEPLHNTLGQ